MFGMGTPELFVIGLVIFLFFGAKRLPELARSAGKAFSEFKKGKDEIISQIESEGRNADGSADAGKSQAADMSPYNSGGKNDGGKKV